MKSASHGDRPRHLHVPLPPRTHAELLGWSKSEHRPATALAREAIEEWLVRRRQERVREEIGAYAVDVAGTPDDLDPGLEALGIEALAKPKKGRRGK